jgi:hypothetical protein
MNKCKPTHVEAVCVGLVAPGALSGKHIIGQIVSTLEPVNVLYVVEYTDLSMLLLKMTNAM